MSTDPAGQEHMGPGEGHLVMPFYLICDVSASMYNEMKELHDGVKRLRWAIIAEPVVDDVAQVCVMTFSDTARVLIPLGPMSECEVPLFTAENLTNYGGLFSTHSVEVQSDND